MREPQQELFKASADNGATFSPCRTWRYALWRIWKDGPLLASIGLNPSTADESVNDPTIRREIEFAKRLRFGGLVKFNLYGFRATKPIDMVHASDPVGPENDAIMASYAPRIGRWMATWGSLPVRWRPRVQWKSRIETVLANVNQEFWCFGYNADGEPKHPLYLPYTVQPSHYWSPPA